MPRPDVHHDRKQRGVALLAALILMLAVVLTLGNIFYRHQLDVANATGVYHSDQASLIALSTENWSRGLLTTEADNRDFDSLEENWAMAVPLLPVEGGYISGCLMDMQARFNLNSFSAYDADLWDTAELGIIRGYSPVMYQALAPYISALPVATPVNVNTAGLRVLLALGGENGENFSTFVVENRPFDTIDEFYDGAARYLNLERAEVEQKWPGSLIDVKSDFFRLNVRVSLGTVTIEVSSLLDRHNREAPIVIQRTLSRVPDVVPEGLNEEMSQALLSECQRMARDNS